MCGDVITQQLHRNNRQKRADPLAHLWNGQEFIKKVRVGSRGSNPDQLSIPRFRFLGIAENLFEHGSWHRNRDHGDIGIEQGDRTVLISPAG